MSKLVTTAVVNLIAFQLFLVFLRSYVREVNITSDIGIIVGAWGIATVLLTLVAIVKLLKSS